MLRYWKASFLGLALMAINAMAQTNTNTFPNSGNVGIGTTNPASNSKLDVEGGMIKIGTGSSQQPAPAIYGIGSDGHNIGMFPSLAAGNYNNIVQGGDQGIIYSNGTAASGAFVIAPWANATSGLRMDATGNVGIGTTNPMDALDVSGTGGLVVAAGLNLNSAPNSLIPLKGTGKLLTGWNLSGGQAETDFISSNVGTVGTYAGGFNFYEYSSDGVATQLVTMLGTGNVGIGTTVPGAKLEVNGNLRLTAGSGASITFPDNTTQATAWTGSLCGGDYAESVDVTGIRAEYEPGDVLVIDPHAKGKFLKSAQPYSTMVMGIYSTKPGLTGRRQATPKNADEVPMAMMGIVPTKVSSENGPIEPGDLLVSSSTPGYAMKGTERGRMLGAVVGKALEGLASGKGVIEVGVTLQ